VRVRELIAKVAERRKRTGLRCADPERFRGAGCRNRQPLAALSDISRIMLEKLERGTTHRVHRVAISKTMENNAQRRWRFSEPASDQARVTDRDIWRRAR
jgi:hypothetical protein